MIILFKIIVLTYFSNLNAEEFSLSGYNCEVLAKLNLLTVESLNTAEGSLEI